MENQGKDTTERIRVYKGFADSDDGFTIETNGSPEHFHKNLSGTGYTGSKGTHLDEPIFGDGIKVTDGSGSTIYRKKPFGAGYSGSDGTSVTPGLGKGTWSSSGGGDTSSGIGDPFDSLFVILCIVGVLLLLVVGTLRSLWPFGFLGIAALIALQILRYPISRCVNAKVVTSWFQVINLILWTLVWSYAYENTVGVRQAMAEGLFGLLGLIVVAAFSFVMLHYNIKGKELFVPKELPEFIRILDGTIYLTVIMLLFSSIGNLPVLAILVLCIPAVIATAYFAYHKVLVKPK